jgi:hypothetical protein
MLIRKISELRGMKLQSVPNFVGVMLLVLFASGCQTPLTVKQMQAKNPLAKNAVKTPTKIVDVWNSYAQTTSEGKVMRGMAGRVHFYGDQKDNQAIKVDGDLTVFVFNGNETDPAHTKPLKVFQFKAETLDKYYSHQKPMGHGYDLFLPIDEIGGEEQSLCIMTRFDDRLQNTYVMTPQSVNTILAGRKPQPPPTEPTIREFLESRSLLAEANQSITASNDSAIQQVAYTSEKEGIESGKSKVSTIPLSGDMTRRLMEAKGNGDRENSIISTKAEMTDRY